MRKEFPTFWEFVHQLPEGIGKNTRAITMAVIWAGERIARAVASSQEAHQVRQMSEEIGQAFIKASTPPPPMRSTRPPPKK